MLQNPKRFCNIVSLQVNIPLVELEKAVSSCELCAFPPEWPFEPCGFAQCRRLWHRKFLTFASRQARFNVPEIDVLPTHFPLARLNQSVDVSDFACFRSASIPLRILATRR